MHYRKKYTRQRWNRLVWLFIFAVSGVCIAQSAGITKHTVYDRVAQYVCMRLDSITVQSCMPAFAYDASKDGAKTVYEYVSGTMQELLPIYGYARAQDTQLALEPEGAQGTQDMESCETGFDGLEQELVLSENQKEETDVQGQGAQIAPRKGVADKRVKKYARQKLADFDYLVQNFYRVDSTTTIDSKKLDAQKMLAKHMGVSKAGDGPQILIYHTHSQERYADSKDASQSVVGLGDKLAALLEKQYGYRVLHHKGTYDLPDRDTAYARAAPALEKLLKKYPSIQVVIDLHRDGVAEGTRLVQQIDGKKTATIMFFNGLSHTTAQGDIGYLYNPNLSDNLAFSFQMQLAAAEYYPGFSRCIYLKGYRYNLHYVPKSLLVEVGAQTNTYGEACNAMAPLADVLDKVLRGKA